MAMEVGIKLTKLLCILPTLIDYGFDVGVEDVVSNKQPNKQTKQQTNKQSADCFALLHDICSRSW